MNEVDPIQGVQSWLCYSQITNVNVSTWYGVAKNIGGKQKRVLLPWLSSYKKVGSVLAEGKVHCSVFFEGSVSFGI